MGSRTSSLLAASLLATSSGCYHYAFEHPTGAAHPGPRASREPRAHESGASGAPSGAAPRTVTYDEHVPTYLNGFVGTGTIDTARYCEHPVRTELQVTGLDVLASIGTLLVYTPHTLYVTCEVGGDTAAERRGVSPGTSARDHGAPTAARARETASATSEPGSTSQPRLLR
jgi:hypothetical protein